MAANYPTSDPSFSAKAGNQTIQAAHVNSLQEEVTAIGTALRGTLQHDVTLAAGKNLSAGVGTFSSGVTVSSGGLTVSTGNVTLGQNLSVAGNSTMSGLTLSSNLSLAGSVTSTLAVANMFRVATASTTLSGGSTRFDNVVVPSTCVFLRVNGNSSAIAISGLSGDGSAGRVVYLANVTGAVVTLLNEDANSSATCRLQLGGANRTVNDGAMVTLVFDGVTGRWRG